MILDKKTRDYGYLHNVFLRRGRLYLYSLVHLPRGRSEGWSSEIIRLSIMWLNSLNSANFAVYPSVHLKCVAHSFKFHSNWIHSLRYENILVRPRG